MTVKANESPGATRHAELDSASVVGENTNNGEFLSFPMPKRLRVGARNDGKGKRITRRNASC